LKHRFAVVNGASPWQNPQEHYPIPRRRVPDDMRPTFDAHLKHAKNHYGPDSWEYPELSASKAVLMARPGLRDRAMRGVELGSPAPFKMPNPGVCVLLAPLLEWTNISEPTVFETYRVGPEYVPLFWSPEHKLLFANISQGRPESWRSPGSEEERGATKLFRDFRWGQDSRGVSDLEVPNVQLQNVGVADTVLYRSGKGTSEIEDPVGVQEYIHQFGYGVHCFQDDAENPTLVCWKGGDLDVVKAGIVN